MTNTRFAGILSLPTELLDKITHCVAAQEILALRCANKVFCSLLTPAAFREIVVHTTDKSSQGFLHLLASVEIAKYVRVVRIIEDPVSYDDDELPEEEERFERVGKRLRGACFMLHLLPALESLVIRFFPGEEAWMNPFTYDDELTRYQFLQWDILGGLACNPTPLPALQSLQIDNWFAYPNEVYDAAPFKRIVASLRDLRFLVQDMDYRSDDDHFPAEDFWSVVIGQRVLQPAANLASLALKSSVEFGSLFRLFLGPISFPCLTSFSLSNFVWDDTRVNPDLVISQAEDFIVRHGKTLKKLVLRNCTISVSPFTNKSTPDRSWAAVWNRFADELTELVGLVVVYNLRRRYVYYFPDTGFEPNLANVLLHGTEQDTPALKAFVTIVRERKRLPSRDSH